MLREAGTFLSRPLEGTGHKPLLVELQEVFAVSYVPDLRHH